MRNHRYEQKSIDVRELQVIGDWRMELDRSSGLPFANLLSLECIKLFYSKG